MTQARMSQLAVANTEKILQCAKELLIDDNAAEPVVLSLKHRLAHRLQCYVVRRAFETTAEEVNRVMHFDCQDEVSFLDYFQFLCPMEGIQDAHEVCSLTSTRGSAVEVIDATMTKKLLFKRTAIRTRTFVKHTSSAYLSEREISATSIATIGEDTSSSSTTSWGFVHGRASNSRRYVVMAMAFLTEKQVKSFTKQAKSKLSALAAIVKENLLYDSENSQLHLSESNSSATPLPHQDKAPKLVSDLIQNLATKHANCYSCNKTIKTFRQCHVCKRPICSACRGSFKGHRLCRSCIDSIIGLEPELFISSGSSASTGLSKSSSPDSRTQKEKSSNPTSSSSSLKPQSYKYPNLSKFSDSPSSDSSNSSKHTSGLSNSSDTKTRVKQSFDLLSPSNPSTFEDPNAVKRTSSTSTPPNSNSASPLTSTPTLMGIPNTVIPNNKNGAEKPPTFNRGFMKAARIYASLRAKQLALNSRSDHSQFQDLNKSEQTTRQIQPNATLCEKQPNSRSNGGQDNKSQFLQQTSPRNAPEYHNSSELSDSSQHTIEPTQTAPSVTGKINIALRHQANVGQSPARLVHLRNEFDLVCRAMVAQYQSKYAFAMVGSMVVGSSSHETIPEVLLQLATETFTGRKGFRAHYTSEFAFIIQKNLHYNGKRVGYFIIADDEVHRSSDKIEMAQGLQVYEDTILGIYESTLWNTRTMILQERNTQAAP